MRLTRSGTVWTTSAVVAVRARTLTVYAPSGSTAPSTVTVCFPAACQARSSTVATTVPAASATSTVTLAGAESEKLTSATSPWPSPFGVMPSGVADASEIAMVASVSVPSPARTVPVAGRAEPALIDQRYEPGCSEAASHVQSSVLPGARAPRDLRTRARHGDRPGQSLREPRAEAHRALGARLDPGIEDLRPAELRRVRGNLVQARVERFRPGTR